MDAAGRGGVEHGEEPVAAMLREMSEETGLECSVERLLTVHDTHFEGTAPSDASQDFHGIHLVYEVAVGAGEPQVALADLTTEQVAGRKSRRSRRAKRPGWSRTRSH